MTDDQIEHRLLELAYTTNVTLTAPALAYFAPCTLTDAQRVLDRLSATDRLRMHVDDDGTIIYELPRREALAPPRAVPPPVLRRQEASPGLAAALSVVVPGAGHLYAGRPIAALMWFVAVALGYLLILPGVFLHILCIVSAATSAHQLNDNVEGLQLNRGLR
jgi:TM2 domain-containing membrane protein YozV